MSVGEIISALVLCASSFDDNKDRLLMLKSVYSIEVGDNDDCINVYFVDGNTQDIKVHRDGTWEALD